MSAVGAEPARRVGMWRAAAGGWRVFVPAVLVNAAVQALLVVSDPVPGWTFGFGALVAGSALVMLVAVWLIACTAAAAVDGAPHRALDRARRHPRVLLWAVGIWLVAVAGSFVEIWLGAVVLGLGAFVLPAATGSGSVPATMYRTITHAPVRSAVAVLVSLTAVALSWIVALSLGFLVTGALAAAAISSWFGLVSVLLLCQTCSLYAVSATRSDDQLG